MSGPLSGIRVIDLTSVVFGPLATQILGDMGAEVIKIEGPEGDTTRYTGPARSSDMAALFMGINRNKRSLVLDMKKESAQRGALAPDRWTPMYSFTRCARRKSRRWDSVMKRF